MATHFKSNHIKIERPRLRNSSFASAGPCQIFLQESLLKPKTRLKMPFETSLTPKIQDFTNRNRKAIPEPWLKVIEAEGDYFN